MRPWAGLALLALVCGCEREPFPPAPDPRCAVGAPAASAVTAVGRGPTEAAAREAAQAEACPKLPPALRPHCYDPARVTAATVLMWDLKEDTRIYEATVTLRPTPCR